MAGLHKKGWFESRLFIISGANGTKSIRILLIFLLALLLVAPLFSQVLSKWFLKQGDSSLTLVFYRNPEGQLRGVMNFPGTRRALTSIRIDGNAVSFKVSTPENGKFVDYIYRGSISGDKMQGVYFRAGSAQQITFSAVRGKPGQ
jgi:hypothetical protein